MRILFSLCLLVLVLTPAAVLAERPASRDYYTLLTHPPASALPSLNEEQQLRSFYRTAWPERGEQGYIATRYVRSARDRQAFSEALERVIRERLQRAGHPRPGSRSYRKATMGTFWDKRYPEPLAHRALLLSLDNELSEDDIWQVASLRLKSQASQDVFADLNYLFSAGNTAWTPEASAVFDLLRQQAPIALGIQQLLNRYKHEAATLIDTTPGSLEPRVALPIHGLYAAEVENLLALLEGYHLWQARGRSDLANAARHEIEQLGATLSSQLGQPLHDDIAGALGAPTHYARVFWQLQPNIYWPTGSEAAHIDHSQVAPPSSPRWIRSAPDTPRPTDDGQAAVTRRVGSTDHRWWPAFQEAYIDLAYRQLPRLIEQQLSAPGTQDVFRVWHAGAEDGSQTFLLAALLDVATEVLAQTSANDQLKQELQALRIEIIASDYTYMPDRDGRIYRFDVSDQIGDLHHKWNLLPGEFGAATSNAPLLRLQALDIQTTLANAEDKTRRTVQLRALADQGLVAELLAAFFTLAPAVDTPSGAWRQHHAAMPAKYRYRLKDTHWRVLELHAGQEPFEVNRGSEQRLIRFEKGDMTRQLPRGFESGNAFDLSVVTSVLPYIYGYYRNVSAAAPLPEGTNTDTPPTPMELAQDYLALGARTGGWILVDPATEHEAQDSKDILATGKSWSILWQNWLTGALAERQVELLVTDSSGVRATHRPAIKSGK